MSKPKKVLSWSEKIKCSFFSCSSEVVFYFLFQNFISNFVFYGSLFFLPRPTQDNIAISAITSCTSNHNL